MRSLPLPCPVSEDVSVAGMRDGILTLQLRLIPEAKSVPASWPERLRHFTRRLGHWDHPSHQLRANP